MSANLQQIVQNQISVLSNEDLDKVLRFVKMLRPSDKLTTAKPISDLFAELSSELPIDEWEQSPSDGAENHDHYLYGAPKKKK